jgi:hypothetical protein
VLRPVNYQWLSQGANSSKQSRGVAAIQAMDPQFRADQVLLEARVRAQLQDIIDKLFKLQGT